MAELKVLLFGRFNIQVGEQQGYMQVQKAQELFSYLLLSQNHSRPRETLSELLWPDEAAASSRKHLRQTLWLLRKTLTKLHKSLGPRLLADGEWIQLDPAGHIWTDAGEFQQALNLVGSKPAHKLTQKDARLLRQAIDLYRGDLLEGWYYDWCLIERERFQMMYMLALDKLVNYCELHHDYERGLTYAIEILRRNPAYELAHCHLMRLYYLVGDRTRALQQYERCASALRNELNIEPSLRTRQLYEQIRSESIQPLSSAGEKEGAMPIRSAGDSSEALQHLTHLAEKLVQIRHEVNAEIQRLEKFISPGY